MLPPCRRIQTFTAECSTAWVTSRPLRCCRDIQLQRPIIAFATRNFRKTNYQRRILPDKQLHGTEYISLIEAVDATVVNQLTKVVLLSMILHDPNMFKSAWELTTIGSRHSSKDSIKTANSWFSNLNWAQYVGDKGVKEPLYLPL